MTPFSPNERDLLKETIKSLKQENDFLEKKLRDVQKKDNHELLKRAIQSEHRFKIIIESVKNIPVQGYNEEREVFYWNKASEEAYGYNREEALGKKIEDLIIPENVKEKVKENINNCLLNLIPVPASEQVLRDKFNNKVHVFSNHVMISNLQGEKEMYSIDLNLSELKKAENELQQTKTHINSIFQAADKVAFIITNTNIDNPEIIEFSPGAENIFNYRKEEVIGKSIAILHKTSDIEKLPGLMKKMKETGRGFNGEVSLVRKSGERFPAFHSTYPLLDKNNKMVAGLGVSIDLSKEKKAENELEEKKTLINAVLTSIQDGIVILDKELNVKFINPVLKSWFPDNKKFKGEKCFSCLQNSSTPCSQCPAIKSMKTGKTESKIISAPEETGMDNIEVFCYPIIDKKTGESIGIVEFIRDISKRVQLEKQLIQSQKMESVGQLAGGIAHDFNNLLTIINGYCELILEDDLSQSNREHLLNIHKAGLRAERLTSQLLAFSRKQMATPIRLNLNQIIKDHIDMVSRVLGEDIKITTDLKSSHDIVFMDPTQFEQVVMNLSVNARDAMPYGGELSIETGNRFFINEKIEGIDIIPGNYVSIKIRDNGDGMDEKVKARVFEPFFTTKERNKGTGLGLSTVYGIVKQNKGFIFVDSQKDKGTEFTILLPEADSAGIPVISKKEIEEELKGSETILYVEDDTSVRKITASILKKYGYKVYSPESSIKAVTFFDEKYNDAILLLTDLIMPEINGKELADILKLKKPEIKILYTSGYTGETITKHGLIEGEYDFIQKPYTKKDIAKKIRLLLNRTL